MTTLDSLFKTLPQRGRLDWIGLRPQRRESMQIVDSVAVDPHSGLHGDRYQGRSRDRQVTLIQAEHLIVVASCLQRDSILAEIVRRNLVVSGINLLALKNKVVNIGDVQLEITGLCHPCSRMEECFGPGGYNAMRGHGGLTARVLNEGVLSVGASVYYAESL